MALRKCNNPRTLFLGLWHPVASCTTQQVKRLLRRKTSEHEHARCHENGSTEPMTAMKRNVFAFGERGPKLLQQREGLIGEWGNAAVSDRKGNVADSLLAAERRFFCKV